MLLLGLSHCSLCGVSSDSCLDLDIIIVDDIGYVMDSPSDVLLSLLCLIICWQLLLCS